MSLRHELTLTRGWADTGTRLLVERLRTLPDGGFATASLLPGWTRAHVVAHVARNAEALVRLATWARTGEETPMYASPEQRDADIAAGATQAAPDLRRDLAATAADLDRAFEALDASTWDARIRVRQGSEVSARVLPWLRVREVWLHAVDLDVGTDLSAAPADLLDELATDMLTSLSARDGCPVVELRPTDRGHVWQLGGATAGAAAPATTMQGSAADLVTWLAGRSDGSTLTADGPVPSLPDWL